MTDVFAWDYTAKWAFGLLVLVLGAAWGHFYWQRQRAGSLVFGNTLAVRQVATDAIGRLWWLPGALRLVGMVALVLAVSRPQKPNLRVVTTQGVDIVICFDVSASMNAVDKSSEEIDAAWREGKAPANRFELARELLTEFIKSRAKGGDRVSLVLFGDGAYLKFPLTTDYRRAIQDIQDLVVDDGRRDPEHPEGCINDCTVSGAKTTIGDALQRAFLRLRDSPARDRSIILVTDGEDKGSKMAPKYVADYIRDWGKQIDPKTKEPRRPIPIYTFLVGGGGSTFMPEMNPFRPTEFVRNQLGFIHLRPVGNQVPVNPELLQYIAEGSGGKSFLSYDEKSFREHFSKLEETIYKRTVNNFPEERFMPFAWMALGCLVLEALLRLSVFRKFP